MATKITAAEEIKVTSTQWDRYVRARDNGHVAYVAMAQKCDQFYIGEQWEPADVLALGDRPNLTLNMVLTTINAVLAEQSARRLDVRFKPKKGGKQEVANVLNKVFEYISTNNRLDWIESQVFSDGLIMDRGYFDVRMDFSKNLRGDVTIKALDPLDVLIDPDAKDSDPRTWNEVFTTKWCSLDDIEETYGKKCADKLTVIAENGHSYGNDSIEWREVRFGDTDHNTANQMPGASSNDKQDVRNIRRLRVIERQHYRMERVDFFVDAMTGDQRQVPENWGEPRARKFAKAYGLSVVSQMIKKVRWTVTCDKVVLHDDWSPYEHFTVVPFFPYFRRGRPFGMVRNLLSPQELLNKVSSQELHIVNTTANSGWLVQNGSLSNMKPDQLERDGAQTGLVIEYNRGAEKPEKIQPNQIPTGLDRIAQMAAASIKAISGVNDNMLNGDAQEIDITNPMKAVQQNRGTIMAQVPLDSLKKSRQYLAEIMLNLVQTFMTEERILQITDDEDPLEPSEELVVNQMTPAGEVINDLTVGSYDVMITTVPARDTFDDQQFLEAMALRSVGVMVPDDAIVMYSHLARKAELAKRIRQSTGVEKTPEQEQIAMLMEQMQIQQVQLQVQELGAKIQKLQSEAAVNMAKVQDMADVQPQLVIAGLQAEMETRMRELDLRRQLAELAANARVQQAETGAAVKLATSAMATSAKQAQAQAKTKPPGAKT